MTQKVPELLNYMIKYLPDSSKVISWSPLIRMSLLTNIEAFEQYAFDMKSPNFIYTNTLMFIL